MGIVLGQPSYSCHAAQFATLFIAVYGAKFSQTNGELPVAVVSCRKNLDMVRAVHRFEEIFLILISLNCWILAVLVIREMSRLFIEINAADVRCENGIIASLQKFILHEILQFSPYDCPLGHP